MKTFIASDIHFNHANILKYCPHRGSDLDDMNRLIISNWNSVINHDDKVFILGDVAMGMIAKAPNLIRQLNGAKMLVRGNHDKTLVKLIKTEGLNLFTDIVDYWEETYVVDGNRFKLIMSHYPFAHWNGQSNGSMMLHGHLHGNPSGITGRIMDMGIDTNSLFPRSLDEVVRTLAKLELRGSHHD